MRGQLRALCRSVGAHALDVFGIASSLHGDAGGGALMCPDRVANPRIVSAGPTTAVTDFRRDPPRVFRCALRTVGPGSSLPVGNASRVRGLFWGLRARRG